MNAAVITSEFIDRWDSLPYDTEETYKYGDREAVEREFMIRTLPEEIREGGGLNAVAIAEFNELKRLSRQLNRDRKTRESFLNSVFSN